MSEDGGPPIKRTKLLREDYEKMSREDLLQRLHDQDAYVATLEAKHGDGEQVPTDDAAVSKEVEDKLKQQQVEATRRENVLVMRLTTKEQEMQEYLNQIQELKQVRNPATTQLRGMLLDPAINLMFQRMKKEMDSCKEKLERAQNDLAAWKFTPDSQTGKRLMAKCRMLLQENEELGKVISAGRTAKLEGEIALEKKFVEEMKKSQAETDEFLVEMDEDMEGMQSTIYFLQQQLKDAKDEVARLRQENTILQQQQDQKPDLVSKSAFTKPEVGANTVPNSLLHSEHVNMDVDLDEKDITSKIDNNKESSEDVRTTSVEATTYLSHTGNNVNLRTSSDGPGEGREARPSVSVHGSDHRTRQPAIGSDAIVGGYGLHRTLQSQHEAADNPTVRASEDSRHSATNGDHVTSMEMDVSEEPASGGNEEAIMAEQSNCHAPSDSTKIRTVSPRPGSPHSQTVPASNACNHGATYGVTSQSSDGAYTFEGTDASSETWSPSNQSKTSGLVSDDEQKLASCGSDRFRTGDTKDCAAERLHNGLVTPTQHDPPDAEIAK